MTDITYDIEATGLLDDTTIDYTTVPYKLKESFKIHVICVEEWESGKILCFYDGPTIDFSGEPIPYQLDGIDHVLEHYTPIEYEHYQLAEFKPYIVEALMAGRIKRVFGHNEIQFDNLACDLVFDMPYDTDKSTWCGLKHGGWEDTLIRSKVQNADRIGGHSLENLAKLVGEHQKYDFRPWYKGVEKFKEFGPDMVYYNIMDVKSNTSVAKWLLAEAGDWNWMPAIHLERCVAEIITRQAHRGFYFNQEQAESNLKFLDAALAEREALITPLLPPKPATKSYQKDFTPPAKPFKKDGSLSATMLKFAEKLGGEIVQSPVSAFVYRGVTYPLPLDPETFVEAVAGSVPATIKDSTHIKGWLVQTHGWNPTEWKERDLSLDAKRKKLSREGVVAAIERYVAQTLASPFKEHRLEYLECKEDQLRSKLLNIKEGKPIRVRTNPSLTVGQEKEVDPALKLIEDRFPHAKLLTEFYTYSHRRNSILGGGAEFDEDSGVWEEAETGFLANVRADGRIPTPAMTCDAATGRMKHKVVCNVPRGTSLFGGEMRALFGVEPTEPVYQFGFDFSTLEGVVEAHECWKYDEEEHPYCNSLLLPKPNDIHTKTATKVSELIGKQFIRDHAKSVKFSATFGAQALKIAKIIGADEETGQAVFDAFWEAAKPLAKLKEDLTQKWEKSGKKYVVGLDGRKVPTRAAHSLVNSRIQSGGSICAKRVLVESWREYKKRGWTIDFFRDNWYNKPYVQQMIFMHDEGQFEISKSLVKWKKFATEEDAKAFQKEQKALGVYWSEPVHSEDSHNTCVYIAYSDATQIVWDSVNKVSKDLKLNVPLAIEFVYGKNWRDCH
jgi:DNA polymerase family A